MWRNFQIILLPLHWRVQEDREMQYQRRNTCLAILLALQGNTARASLLALQDIRGLHLENN